MHELKDLPDGFAQGIWAKLAQQSELAEMPSDVKAKYIKDMETEMDKRAQMKCALRKATEQGLAAGRAQGFEQGHSDGLEQGRAEGRAEGRTEGRAEGLEQGKLETARKMKEAGIDVDIICQCTSLTKEQVAAL